MSPIEIAHPIQYSSCKDYATIYPFGAPAYSICTQIYKPTPADPSSVPYKLFQALLVACFSETASHVSDPLSKQQLLLLLCTCHSCAWECKCIYNMYVVHSMKKKLMNHGSCTWFQVAPLACSIPRAKTFTAFVCFLLSLLVRARLLHPSDY